MPIYGCDSIIMDLEDAVAENQKDVARFSLYHTLKTIDYEDTEVVVRINGLDTTHWQEDIRCVVAAAGGYPENYKKDDEITGVLDFKESEDNKIFICGAKVENGKLLTNGGRVLNAVALGNTLEEAQKKAYELLKTINFEGMYFRKDIGGRF